MNEANPNSFVKGGYNKLKPDEEERVAEESPNLMPVGEVSEAMGGNDSQLEKKYKELDYKAKRQTKKEKFNIFTIGELLGMEFKDDWVVEELIPRGGITIVSGAPSSFKTWIIMQMAISISKGEPFLGRFKSVDPTGVLMIDKENPLRVLQLRMKLLGATDNLPIYFISQEDFLVTKNKHVERILKICEKKNIKVIFIDSLIRISKAEENSAKEMSEVTWQIRKFCKAGKTVIVTHHDRKEGLHRSPARNRLRGSSDILASVDSHLAVTKKGDDVVIVEQAKLRIKKEIKPFELTLREGTEKTYFEYLGATNEVKNAEESAKKIVLEIVRGVYPEGLSRGEITKMVWEESKIGRKSVKKAIDSLIKNGEINEKRGKGHSKICTFVMDAEL
jgi:archaellum biogenesis ATPase FlaH